MQNNDKSLQLMEELHLLSIRELTSIIKTSECDKIRIAAIAQARGLLKDSGVAVQLDSSASNVVNLANVSQIGNLPFKVPANG